MSLLVKATLRARVQFLRSTITRAAALGTLVASASLAIGAATKGPDASGYSGTDETVYSFVDIAGAGGGVKILGGTDDGMAALTMPFAFQFYGQPFTVVCVSSNGVLYFVPSAAVCDGFTDFANADLTSTALPKDLPAVLPFWSDLTFDVPGAGAIYYHTVGAAGSRRFIVEWSDTYPQGSSSPVTFQAILTEATNTVLFQYRTVELGAGNAARNGAQATIGIRNAGAPANQRLIAWSYNAPVVTDNSALLFSAVAPVVCAANVDSSVSVTRLGFVYNPGTQRFSQTVRITNTSGTTIDGPVGLVLDALTANVTLANVSGTTTCVQPTGRPHITASTGALAPGATVSVVLQFANPGKASISYSTRALAGNGTR